MLLSSTIFLSLLLVKVINRSILGHFTSDNMPLLCTFCCLLEKIVLENSKEMTTYKEEPQIRKSSSTALLKKVSTSKDGFDHTHGIIVKMVFPHMNFSHPHVLNNKVIM